MHQRLDIRDMGQSQNTAAIEMLVMGHVARNDRQAHIDPTEKGLDLDHFRHLARAGNELVKGSALSFVQCHPQ